MKITIAHISGRKDPKWRWFVDSLARQTTPMERTDIELLFVDGLLWHIQCGFEPAVNGEVPLAEPMFHNPERRQSLEAIVDGRFNFRHIPEKPCAWKGPFRQTSQDFFCASNSRNTAIMAASGEFVACVDDLSVLNEIWYGQVFHAALNDYVVCGSYAKQNDMVVEDGKLVSFTEFPGGRDSRWQSGSSKGIVPWTGRGLYGCSFGLPIEAALEVDGFDGAGNGQGFEDCDFGARLERAGWAIYYNANMLSVESEPDHHRDVVLKRDSKLVSPDRLPAGYTGNPMSDHVMLHRMTYGSEVTPFLGDGLRVMRKRFLETGMVPLPAPNQVDWRDGTPLSQL